MIPDRAYTRAKTWSKALRKYHIDRDRVHGGHLYYDNLHQYADNSIHCSCALCRAKTNNRGKHSLAPNTNWNISDKRKIERMEEQIGEEE